MEKTSLLEEYNTYLTRMARWSNEESGPRQMEGRVKLSGVQEHF